MAIRYPTVVSPTKGVLIAKWTGLLKTDTGAPVSAPQHSDRSVQVYGTFGAGGEITIEGANDALQSVNNPSPATPVYATLHEANTYTVLEIADDDKIWEIEENPTQIRPNCTDGEVAVTDLTVVITMKAGR